MDQRVRFRAAHRCAARPAHPSRPYPAIEWRQLQAQTEQAPITPFQFRYAGGSSQPSLILVETAPRWGLLPASLMYFCFGRPMHHCTGVDTGFKLDEVIADGGVSGVSTKLRERPQGRRLFDLLRSGDTLVVRWGDRLGRDCDEICETL